MDDDIAVMFTDIRMPGSIDGATLAAFVRGTFPGMKVLISSGYSTGNVHIEDLPFIRKPYSYRMVLDFILSALS